MCDLTPNGRGVLERRYIRRDECGNPIETIDEMFMRVARHIAKAHEEPGTDAYTDLMMRYLNMMIKLRFLPNSPTFTGAATELGQLAACFVLPIDDDIGKDSTCGIFSTLRNAALIQQSGGGVGFSFSRLRHKGDRVKKSSGIASGPISFMKVYDVAFGAIAQGGIRRGAAMGSLRVDHPDILEFINCKSEDGVMANFNISVGITDAFMECVEKDLPFYLISPRTGMPVNRVSARELMNEIVTHAHANGEPGLLFLDRLNETNPLSHKYTIETTNPCGKGFILHKR